MSLAREDPHLSLPTRLRARGIRERAGWSRQRVADELGVHVNSVVRWEHGIQMPTGRNLWPYAELLARLDRSPQGGDG